jgi:hypothetical protein
VQVDVEGEQEAAFGWGGDAGLEVDGLHGIASRMGSWLFGKATLS